MSVALSPTFPTRPLRPQYFVVVGAAALLVSGAAYAGAAVSGRQAALYLIGAALGFALYHAVFGFTGAYRRFIVEHRGRGIRAQMFMLALASIAFAPLLAGGDVFGQNLGGALAPVGVSVMIGAFIFGAGMQLGGGCASGTLFTVGAGHTRMILTLLGFIAGSALGSAHLPWWLGQPKMGSLSIFGTLGWPGGLALQLVFIACIVWFTLFWEKRRHGTVEREPLSVAPSEIFRRIVRGPWPLLWGAGALALLNLATLLVAGRPWGITWGFTLWGGKVLDGVGFDLNTWAFWRWPGPARALEAPLIEDVTSLMNIGILVGALLAAGLAGGFAPTLRIPPRAALAALIGGVMLGYGARLAFGCNIGAFFSGAASGSVHGWLWLAFALLGTVAGVAARPLFGFSGLSPAGAPA